MSRTSCWSGGEQTDRADAASAVVTNEPMMVVETLHYSSRVICPQVTEGVLSTLVKRSLSMLLHYGMAYMSVRMLNAMACLLCADSLNRLHNWCYLIRMVQRVLPLFLS